MSHSEQLIISKSELTGGDVTIQGSKNSGLALLIATCLTTDSITLNNMPKIEDIFVINHILANIGAKVDWTDDNLTVDTSGIPNGEIPLDLSNMIRPSYYFVGALINRFGKVKLGYPGGDKIGKRPIDMHIAGLRALGADVNLYEDYYTVEVNGRLKGSSFMFNRKSCGTTINLILAGVLAQGKTTLYNCALDPEVVDLVQLLCKMGAKIKGAGTTVITIEGVESLHGAVHSVIPDRFMAGLFMICAGMSKAPIRIHKVIPKHVESVIQKLEEMGLTIDIEGETITAHPAKKLASTVVFADMYPAFPSDLQQPMTVLLTQADGQSVVVDQVWKHRFALCKELDLMGANTNVSNHGLSIIHGPTPLKGTSVYANDIRGGLALVFAGLIATGSTTINNCYQIHRGSQSIISDMVKLGGFIEEVQSEKKQTLDIGSEQMSTVKNINSL